MACPLIVEKKRIMGLRCRKFESFDILADDWIPEAGRSKFLVKVRTCWVLIFGIPLHLRSKELFHSVGDLCGGFLDYDVTN
ncbi:hypothetical protein LINGRAHAP2_LOCUS23335 [Linum grandiflorum]